MTNDVLDQVDYNPLLLEMLIENDFLRLFMYRVVEGKSCFLVNWIKDPKVWPNIGDVAKRALAKQLAEPESELPSLFKSLCKFESGEQPFQDRKPAHTVGTAQLYGRVI